MQPIDMTTASMLLDFSGGDPQLAPLGQLQMEGAVALQNMLADPEVGIGYLADEVGMGKTYVTLGVVAMMRYFNPAYRVLYICPSRNVQEKWYGREHPNFIKTNVLTRNYKIRTPQGDPGTPSISCSSVDELIHAATTGYYGDIFVRMSSFSMAMGEDEEGLHRHWQALKEHVPASVLSRYRLAKEDIKKAYAKALNYLLPTFDLVVIDEAHNFKHSFESSARNLALSRILGFNSEDDENYRRRVKSALLLSATPFDVNPLHLYNQLNLVGKSHLLPEADRWQDKGCLRAAMAKFMVRRLNELIIRGERHTRNMYRREWRKGERAEVGFESDEHKLITALVQKHIGDVLNREGGSPSFQLGLLASFESYAQTTRSGPVEFDGEKAPETRSDAQDRHLIAAIRDSYVLNEGFGKSLPHPKMDQVSREAATLALERGRKQLIFVRRVKSVSEIKQKLDDEYDDWMRRHIENALGGSSQAARFMERVWDVYHEVRKRRDDDISGGEVESDADEEEERLPPKNDTIFNWFFRGERPVELEQALAMDLRRWPTPEALKKSLIARNSANVVLFEFNWAAWVASAVFDIRLEELIDRIGEERVRAVLGSAQTVAEDDTLSLFLSVQQAFLEEVANHWPDCPALSELAAYLKPLIRSGGFRPSDAQVSRQILSSSTFFSHLYETGLADYFFGTTGALAAAVREGDKAIYEQIHRVEIHRQLLAQSFRSGHPFIDLYLARLILGEAELNESRRQLWLRGLCQTLEEQRHHQRFGTATELSRLNDNLDLVIKNNLPGVYARQQDELRLWLNRQVPSSAPVIGANGETTANRSVQARKFRMPGYPLVLVSTDVFQEGEDLHTFCDSVIHYGLSSSPISIEQKTGRVDRVGAFAHRHLLGLDGEREVVDDDFIQVRFPFVRQSIEAIQVRTLCNNLNVFLGTLHEIGGGGVSIDEFVDTSRELASRNEIPDQLLEFLESPYAPLVTRRFNPELERKVSQDTEKYRDAARHVMAMVQSVVGVGRDRSDSLGVCVPGLEHHGFEVRLDSARSCGEMLLRVTANDAREVIGWSELTREWIVARQAELYRRSLYRTYGIRVRDGLELRRDAEMLVGGPGITDRDDIIGLFARFALVGEETGDPVSLDEIIPELDEHRVNEYLTTGFHWSGTFACHRHAGSLALVFQFDEDRRRKREIHVRYWHGCCYFETQVADEAVVEEFSRDKLLRCTWLRNRNVDLVGFLVRPDGCLVARALHPAASMGFEEFVFSAYVLAVEADRMAYLIMDQDQQGVWPLPKGWV